MTKGAARLLVVATFLLYTLVLCWPGVLPFNRIRPFVLGLPFSFAWVILWVILGGLALLVADRSFANAANEEDDARLGPEFGPPLGERLRSAGEDDAVAGGSTSVGGVGEVAGDSKGDLS